MYENISKKISLFQELKDWALSHQIKHSTVTKILQMFRSQGFDYLPSDRRTLLKNPNFTNIVGMGQGSYWYNGIKSSLQGNHHFIQNSISINLLFNIDGISPYNSSSLEFWPILFRVENMPQLKPMVASIYFGHGKPPLDSFLSPFVDELNQLIEEGL